VRQAEAVRGGLLRQQRNPGVTEIVKVPNRAIRSRSTMAGTRSPRPRSTSWCGPP